MMHSRMNTDGRGTPKLLWEDDHFFLPCPRPGEVGARGEVTNSVRARGGWWTFSRCPRERISVSIGLNLGQTSEARTYS
jgi:hypothetical protein